MEFLDLIRTIQEAIPGDYAWVAKVISDIFPALALLMALLLCFFGYKVHRLWAVFLFFGVGFFIGLITGVFLLSRFPNLGVWASLVPPLALGALGAIFSKRLHKLQLFLVNAAMAYVALPGLLSRYLPDTAAVLLSLAAALVAGVLAVKYKHIVTIFTTAFGGAVSAVPMVLEIVTLNSFTLMVVLELALAAAGVAVQFLLKRREKG